jgi:arylsulfate sulfotransferase
VGTSITWTATVSGDPDSAPVYAYKFTAEGAGQPKITRTGFMRSNTMVWTPSVPEGAYNVDVVVKNLHAGTSASGTANYTLTSLYIGGKAAINTTNNPLVALFTGPACQAPNSMRVRFTPVSVPSGHINTAMTTNLVKCRFDTTSPTPDGTSMNFYVGGMYPSTQYMMHWETVRPNGTLLFTGADYPFTTGAIPSSVNLPAFTPVGSSGSPVDAILLYSTITLPVNGKLYVGSATDLKGNVLWYTTNTPPIRTEFGGSYFGTPGNADLYLSSLREVDLAGNTILETSVGDVNDQLVAMGKQKVTSFHHDVRRLYNPSGAAPSGYIMAFGSTEFAVTSAGQCGTTGGNPNTCDVLGDMIVVFDQNLNVKWVWDNSQFLDTNKQATLNETCPKGGGGGCPPYFGNFNVANDWTHSNALQYTAYDGNIVLSMRHQDAVLKVKFGNGSGDGHVIWKIGPGAVTGPNNTPLPTFAVSTVGTGGQTDINFPLFSHQHDSEIQYNGFSFNGFRVLTVFDNGNLRDATNPGHANSRCQLYAINETTGVANLNTNLDMGTYSFAIGSAQLLSNGSVACDSGFIGGFAAAGTHPETQAVEGTQAGSAVYHMSAAQTSYRVFRMKDLFNPVNP